MVLDRTDIDRLLAFARRTVALLQSKQVSFLAAGIAYYAFVSVLPMLLLVLAVGSLLGGEDVAAAVIAALRDLLSPVGQDVLRSAVVSARGRAPATVASVLLLVWSTLKVFRGLDIAFSRIYGTDPSDGILDQVTDAVVGLGAVGAAVAAVGVVGVLLARTGVTVPDVVGPVALIAVLSLVFFPLYYLFPDSDVSARAALPGTVLGATSWALLGTVFGVYAEVAGASVYGVLGAVLLLITWFYVGSLALLTGVILNAVLAAGVDTGNDKAPPADVTTNERP